MKQKLIITLIACLMITQGCTGEKVLTGKQTVSKQQKAQQFNGFELKHVK